MSRYGFVDATRTSASRARTVFIVSSTIFFGFRSFLFAGRKSVGSVLLRQQSLSVGRERLCRIFLKEFPANAPKTVIEKAKIIRAWFNPSMRTQLSNVEQKSFVDFEEIKKDIEENKN